MRQLTVPIGPAIAIAFGALVAAGAIGYWLGISDHGYGQKNSHRDESRVATAANGSARVLSTEPEARQVGAGPDENRQERRRGNPVFAKLLEDLTEIGRTEPKKAFEEIRKITPESFQPQLRVALAKILLKDNFSKLGEILMLVDNNLDQQSVLWDVLPAAIKRDQDETLFAIRQQLNGIQLNSALRITVLLQLQEGEIGAAMKTQLSMPFSDDRDQAVANIAREISAKGLDPALEWLKHLQEEEQIQTKRLIQEFFVEKRDYPALERLLGMTSDAREREMLIRVIASQFKSSDEPGAQALMNSLPAQERDFVRVQHIINNPSATFETKMRMAAGLSGIQARSDAFRGIVAKEVQRNPAEAGAMALSLPNEVRLFGVSEVVGQWARIDSEAVSVWVQQIPRGEIREGAITRLAQSFKYKDRATAREVASWLENQQKREALIQNIGQ